MKECAQERTAPVVKQERVLMLSYRALPHPTRRHTPRGNRRECHPYSAGMGLRPRQVPQLTWSSEWGWD